MNYGEECVAEPATVIELPAPAAYQAIAYATRDDEVQLLLTDETGANGLRLSPDEARSLADRLYDVAYSIDGGGYDADLGTF